MKVKQCFFIKTGFSALKSCQNGSLFRKKQSSWIGTDSNYERSEKKGSSSRDYKKSENLT